MIVFIYKWLKNAVFRIHQTLLNGDSVAITRTQVRRAAVTVAWMLLSLYKCNIRTDDETRSICQDRLGTPFTKIVVVWSLGNHLHLGSDPATARTGP
jgi:hypothetical protein